MKICNHIFTACLLFISCNTLKISHSYPFTVTEASYYSWFVNEKERGIQVTISLNDIREGVSFDSLVFRAMKIPVTTETKDDNVFVKAVLPGNESVLENRVVPDSGLNRLIYTWKGERSFYGIEKLTRKDSKYLKRK
jgi:hypothetical protein